MLEAQEDVFYYVTVMNENYAHPAMPAGAEEGILRGMYLLQPRDGAQVQLLGSGAILREVISAAETLEREHGVAANVWSVTSWTELHWDGMAAERTQRGGGAEAESWVTRSLAPTAGPIVAASDYVRAVADLARPYVPAGRAYTALGTDGFGRSDTRAALRAFFEVDRDAIVNAALAALGRKGGKPASDAAVAPPWTR